jgi:hypothetical protein
VELCLLQHQGAGQPPTNSSVGQACARAVPRACARQQQVGDPRGAQRHSRGLWGGLQAMQRIDHDRAHPSSGCVLPSVVLRGERRSLLQTLASAKLLRRHGASCRDRCVNRMELELRSTSAGHCGRQGRFRY